jgi:hypothetical protein
MYPCLVVSRSHRPMQMTSVHEDSATQHFAGSVAKTADVQSILDNCAKACPHHHQLLRFGCLVFEAVKCRCVLRPTCSDITQFLWLMTKRPSPPQLLFFGMSNAYRRTRLLALYMWLSVMLKPPLPPYIKWNTSYTLCPSDVY